MADSSSNWFQPSRLRILIAVIAAGICFCLPQQVPLEWLPLKDDGENALYLELSCASDKEGTVAILYDLTTGFSAFNSLTFPIAQTGQLFTYTFPLPAAPITGFRIVPVADGGTLWVRQLRIIDRRGNEERRFTRENFFSSQGIEKIAAWEDGWSVKSASGSVNPILRLPLATPIVARDINRRNFVRSALSTGYVALVLSVFLAAVAVIFVRPANGKGLLASMLFMVAISALFATVANRALIRNSLRYAQFRSPPAAARLTLEIDLVSSSPSPTQIFWDIGHGINGDDSHRQTLESHRALQTVRFTLPLQEVKELRYDPRDNAGSVRISGIRVVDSTQITRAVLPLDVFQPVREIAECRLDGGTHLHVLTTPAATDAILMFRPDALDRINHAIRGMRKH